MRRPPICLPGLRWVGPACHWRQRSSLPQAQTGLGGGFWWVGSQVGEVSRHRRLHLLRHRRRRTGSLRWDGLVWWGAWGPAGCVWCGVGLTAQSNPSPSLAPRFAPVGLRGKVRLLAVVGLGGGWRAGGLTGLGGMPSGSLPGWLVPCLARSPHPPLTPSTDRPNHCPPHHPPTDDHRSRRSA